MEGAAGVRLVPSDADVRVAVLGEQSVPVVLVDTTTAVTAEVGDERVAVRPVDNQPREYVAVGELEVPVVPVALEAVVASTHPGIVAPAWMPEGGRIRPPMPTAEQSRAAPGRPGLYSARACPSPRGLRDVPPAPAGGRPGGVAGHQGGGARRQQR